MTSLLALLLPIAALVECSFAEHLRYVRRPSVPEHLGLADIELSKRGAEAPSRNLSSALPVKATALRSFAAHNSTVAAETKSNRTQETLWPGTRSLLVCNAYALQGGLNVFARVPQRSGDDAKEADLLTHESLTYKQCESLSVPVLGPGSVLDFRASSSSDGPLVGSFVLAGGMPTTGAELLIVVFRHDRYTSVADFASHVFDASDEPQVAVIDAFCGKEPRPVGLPGASGHTGAGLEVRPGFQWKQTALTHSDEAARDVAWHLAQYGSELSLPENPLPAGRGAVPTGSWEFRLPENDPNGYMLELWPYEGQKYVALRVGVDAANGPHFPEELVILPQGSRVWRANRNGSPSLHSCGSKILTLVLVGLGSLMGS